MRFHRIHFPVTAKGPAWPIAVYEGDRQLVCEEDYIQSMEMFFVVTDHPEQITFKRLDYDRFGGDPPSGEVWNALGPDDRNSCARGR